MHITLVVNPRASKVTPARRRAVEVELSRVHTLSVVATEDRDHATELARAAVEDRSDAVAVLGGDGTLNEVAQALVGTDSALLALPGGGTNVFCRTIGLPSDPAAAAASGAGALRDGSLRRIGVGEAVVDGRAPRSFVIHTGIGWDAALVSIVERHSRLKRHLGHALFVYAGLRTFFADFDRRREHFDVRVDGGDTTEAFFALAMNSDPYTFVGPRPFSVDPDNTAEVPLTVVVLSSMSVPHFLTVMSEALRGGGIRARPWLDVHRRATSVEVRRRTSATYQLDGDHLGDLEELDLRYRPDRLWVVVPDR